MEKLMTVTMTTAWAFLMDSYMEKTLPDCSDRGRYDEDFILQS
jgi:hypothetical protein